MMVHVLGDQEGRAETLSKIILIRRREEGVDCKYIMGHLQADALVEDAERGLSTNHGQYSKESELLAMTRETRNEASSLIVDGVGRTSSGDDDRRAGNSGSLVVDSFTTLANDILEVESVAEL